MAVKKCKICGHQFQPGSSTQKVCTLTCAIELARNTEKKLFKKNTRELKADLLEYDRKHWMKKLQIAFNMYIRERDKGQKCISCKRDTNVQMQAGHFLTTGAHPEMRFNSGNCHLQCSSCNNYLSGHLIEYRKNLIKKIGINHVEWLESYHKPYKWTLDEVKEAIELYNDLRKDLL